MKNFYDKAKQKGFKIFLISNRDASLYGPTKQNLETQGYTGYEQIIIRKDGTPKVSSRIFKEQERENLINQGYDIVATIGDQESDILGEHTGIKIKIPNYLYLVK